MSLPSVRVPLLTVVVHRESPGPGFTGLCAGYNSGEWRAKELARELFRSLPGFALRYGELAEVDPDNMVELVERAAGRVYQTRKFKNRGEFGELMLHAILRQVFSTEAAISKVYFKDAANDTVKGFDAVHVSFDGEKVELWLGEVKFYRRLSNAIRDVVAELEAHTKENYLRKEFIAIQHKIDDAWPHAEVLKKLLHENTPLEQIVDAICIPVLLTYDSSTVASHSRFTDEYKKALSAEFEAHYRTFTGKQLPADVKIHLFLVPLNTKASLICALHKRLKAWQQTI